jgi:two-component system NtrC family sensor kinase
LGNAYNELKMVQSQVLQQEKMASIGQLAAGVAHEINNPMGFIISNLNTLKRYLERVSEYMTVQTAAVQRCSEKCGNSNILAEIAETRKALKIDYITEDLDNLIKESLEGADRVKKIVQDLKNFSRVDESEFKAADINSGLESTINIVWNELKYKATLVKEYGDIPLTVCNPGQLNQVFMNLLVNAAHAIEKQGEIRVRTWFERGLINITISDSGTGISEENQKRIFEPFFTTKEVGKGTGLGLSIAYDIIKKHNGMIKVDSEVGKGTTFKISIPVVP